MPSSVVRSTADPEEHALVIRPVDNVFMVPERGTFAGRACKVDLNALWMQSSETNLGQVFQATIPAARLAVMFPITPGGTLAINGTELGPFDFCVLPPGREFCSRTKGRTAWGSVSLPLAALTSWSAAATGRDWEWPRHVAVGRAAEADLARLRQLHRSARALADVAPEVIRNEQAAQGLEQALADALLRCVAPAPVGPASGRQQTVIARFLAVLEQNAGKALGVPQLCKAVGVPERSLRQYCKEQFGMGPKRYAVLRRMYLARQALLAADPATESVTGIATRFSFWELGRFAVEFRHLFGESPSATLRRAASGG